MCFLPSDALRQAYASSRYAVWRTPRQCCWLSIGQSAPLLWDAWLRQQQWATWALLSAYNPASCRLPMILNQARHVALQLQLRQLKVMYLPALGESVDGRWRENSLLLLAPAVDVVHEIACRFGQLAWVAGGIAQPVSLVWTAQYA